jgi:NAD(P)-dependent dehydrogenase (short-subunit alcohol dehydrogenase family)
MTHWAATRNGTGDDDARVGHRMSVVAVTGANAGVGRACVRAFARRGDDVTDVRRDEQMTGTRVGRTGRTGRTGLTG